MATFTYSVRIDDPQNPGQTIALDRALTVAIFKDADPSKPVFVTEAPGGMWSVSDTDIVPGTSYTANAYPDATLRTVLASVARYFDTDPAKNTNAYDITLPSSMAAKAEYTVRDAHQNGLTGLQLQLVEIGPTGEIPVGLPLPTSGNLFQAPVGQITPGYSAQIRAHMDATGMFPIAQGPIIENFSMQLVNDDPNLFDMVVSKARIDASLGKSTIDRVTEELGAASPASIGDTGVRAIARSLGVSEREVRESVVAVRIADTLTEATNQTVSPTVVQAYQSLGGSFGGAAAPGGLNLTPLNNVDPDSVAYAAADVDALREAMDQFAVGLGGGPDSIARRVLDPIVELGIGHTEYMDGAAADTAAAAISDLYGSADTAFLSFRDCLEAAKDTEHEILSPIQAKMAVRRYDLLKLFPSGATAQAAEAVLNQVHGSIEPTGTADDLPYMVGRLLRDPSALTDFPSVPADVNVERVLQKAYPNWAVWYGIHNEAAHLSGIGSLVDASTKTALQSASWFADAPFDVASIDPVALIDASESDAIADIQRLQRLFALVPDRGAVDQMAIVGKNYGSATDILKSTRSDFVNNVGFPTGDEGIAHAVYTRAQTRQAAALAVWNAAVSSMPGQMPGPLADAQTAFHETIELQDGTVPMPFGVADTSDCEHCASVLSPAAYFVDLMAWLDERELLTDLNARRPDLASVQLTCDNTHTSISAVQRAVEVMDAAIGTRTAADAGQLISNVTIQALSAYWTAPMGLVGDWHMPYMPKVNFPVHLSGKDAVHIASFANIDVMALGRAVHSSGRYAASLGMSPTMFVDLSTAMPGNMAWGYDGSDPWVSEMSQAPEFLRRTGLTPDDLVRLPKSYLAQETGLNVSGGPSLAETEIVGFVEWPTSNVLWTVLRRAALFGADWWDLDLYRTALANAGVTEWQMDPSFIDAVTIQNRFGFTADQVAGWFDAVDLRDVDNPDSVFQRTFGQQSGLTDNGQLQPSIDSAALAKTVKAAFGFTDTDVAWLQQSTNAIAMVYTAEEATIFLARSNAVASLADAMDRTPSALVNLLSWMETDPFTAPIIDRMDALLTFIDAVERHDAGPWTDEELTMVLRAEGLTDATTRQGALGWVASREGFSAEQWDALTSTTSGPSLFEQIGMTDWANLGDESTIRFEQYDMLRALFALANAADMSVDAAATLLAFGATDTTAAPIAMASMEIANGLGVSLVNGFSNTLTEANLRDPRRWVAYVQANNIVDVSTIEQWMADITTQTASLDAIAEQRLGPAEYRAAIEEGAPVMLARKRDALAEYLSWTAAGRASQADVVASVLNDVYVDGCTETTVVQEAIAAVQYFVHERMRQSDNAFSEQDRATWRWLKTYRIWEVTRKLFLWPDNWLLPELRTQKSSQFKVFEEEVLAGGQSQDELFQAVLNLARGIDELSSIRVDAVGVATEGDVEFTHLFGRGASTPGKLYHRVWENRSHFSPWEELPFAVDSKHLLPVTHNQRLRLYWTTFTEQVTAGRTHWQIQLSYSEQTGTGWTPPIALAETIDLFNVYAEKAAIGQYFLLSESTDSGTEIHVHCQLQGSQRRADTLRRRYDEKLVELNLAKEARDSESVSNVRVVRDLSEYVAALESELLTIQQDYHNTAAVTGKTPRLATVTVSGCSGENQVEIQPSPEEFAAPDFAQFGSQKWVFAPRTSSILPSENDLRGTETNEQLSALFGATGSDAHPLDEAPYESVRYARALSQININAAQTTRDGMTFVEEPGDEPLVFMKGIKPALVWPHVTGDFAGQFPFIVCDSERSYLVAAQTDPRRASAEGGLDKPIPDGSIDADAQVGGNPVSSDTRYVFTPLHHPFACDIVRAVNRFGPFGVFDPAAIPEQPGTDSLQVWTYQSQDVAYFEALHSPDPTSVVSDYPRDVVDFDAGGAMSLYNWEFFFYAPFFIAQTLSDQGRYEEASDWFHTLYDPRQAADNTGSTLPAFKVKPLNQGSPQALYQRMAALAEGNLTEGELRTLRIEAEASARDPFDPHAIAQVRPDAMQRALVLRYLEHRLDWADSLFRNDTRESLTEAVGLYLEVQELLGEQPVPLDQPVAEILTADRSWTTISTQVGDVIDRVESRLNPDVSYQPIAPREAQPGRPLPTSLATSAFGIPRNDRWDVLWDRVEDRLFKLRHCMNIDGVTRQLAFFEPPLDVLGFLRSRGALDGNNPTGFEQLGANDRPIFRFTTLLMKARQSAELARSIANALQSALASKDGEELQQLRSSHQAAVYDAMEAGRKLAANEARRQLDALRVQLDGATYRLDHFEGLLENGNLVLEDQSIDHQEKARKQDLTAGSLRTTAGVLNAFGTVTTGSVWSWETGPYFVGQSLEAIASGLSTSSSNHRTRGAIASIRAGQSRRNQDWGLQVANAKREVAQLESQIAASEVRIEMMDREYDVVRRQILNQQDEAMFLQTKFTDESLYAWMTRQASKLLRTAYNNALTLAQHAESAFNLEVGTTTHSDIQTRLTYWDASKRGLMAPEHLLVALDSLDASYITQYKRRFELTKSVSVERLDAAALADLRMTGTCQFTVPEALFDLDFPTHHTRRMRNVLVSIPCTTGRYSEATATLELAPTDTPFFPPEGEAIYPHSSTRNALGVEIPDADSADTRVALSTGRNDGGLFRPSTDDARYLPFEYRGVNATWKLTLSGGEGSVYTGTPQFDWMTIADVVLTIQYEAEGDANPEDAKARVSAWIDGTEGPRSTIQSVSEDSPEGISALMAALAAPSNNYNLAFGAEVGTAASRFVTDSTVAWFNLSQDWSLAYWFRPNSAAQSDLICQWSATGNGLFMQRQANSTDIVVHLDAGSGRYSVTFEGSPDWQWAHLALVNTGHTSTDLSQLQLYVNGQPAARVSETATGSFQGWTNFNGAVLSIGGAQPGDNSPNTNFDDVLVYNNHALTPAEVSQLAQTNFTGSPVPSTPPGTPDHYWPLGDVREDLEASTGQDFPLRPTVLHDTIGNKHFTQDPTHALGVCMLEQYATAAVDATTLTIPLANSDLPYAMEQLRQTDGQRLQVEKITLWYVYEDDVIGPNYMLVSHGVVYGNPNTNDYLWIVQDDNYVQDITTVAGRFVKAVHNAPTANDELKDLHVTLYGIPDGLIDIVAVVDWTIVSEGGA